MVPPPGVQCVNEINIMRPQTGKNAPLIMLTTYAHPPNRNTLRNVSMTDLEAIRLAVEGYETPQKHAAPRLDHPEMNKPTALYFIAMEGPEAFVKIGIASAASIRISNIQACCPYPLRLLKLVEGGWDLEKSLHKRFAHLRVRGEWFRLTGDLEKLIEDLALHPHSTGGEQV